MRDGTKFTIEKDPRLRHGSNPEPLAQIGEANTDRLGSGRCVLWIRFFESLCEMNKILECIDFVTGGLYYLTYIQSGIFCTIYCSTDRIKYKT